MNLQAIIDQYGSWERYEKIERYRQLNQMAEKGAIVFAGSSLAEQFPINEMLQNTSCTAKIYNRGISGDVIDGLTKDLDVCVLDLQPSKVFINIGSNDISQPHYSEEILLEKYKAILLRIKDHVPNVSLYILSYYPVNGTFDSIIPKDERDIIFSTRSNKAINQANLRLIQLASDLGATYIDVSTVLMDQHNELDETLTLEGIHIWPKGYERVFNVLRGYF